MEMCRASFNWSCFTCFFSIWKYAGHGPVFPVFFSVARAGQPERLFHNILCLKRPLVGPLVFSLSLILIFGRGRGAVKDTPCTLDSNDC